MNEASNKEQSLFSDNLHSSLSVKRNYESKQLNDQWIDLFEETLPYLDNILRNPKRFIINEEEIVKVELAKKITVESVIHLTQHTNFIQDYDPTNGDVRPSKILNINKEESLDTYENRFIHTLLLNMRSFFEQRCAAFQGESSMVEKVHISYDGSTKIGEEEIEITLGMKTFEKGGASLNPEKGSIKERLAKIKIQLDGFMSSELMQTLNKLHVAAVRSPIRKTNVILKNPNFQKAVDLWNFIQSYEGTDYKFEKEDQEYMDEGELHLQFDESFLLNYLALDSVASKKQHVSSKKAMKNSIHRLVENILDLDPELTEESLKEVFCQELKQAKEKVVNRDQIIQRVLLDTMHYYEREIIGLCESLK